MRIFTTANHKHVVIKKEEKDNLAGIDPVNVWANCGLASKIKAWRQQMFRLFFVLILGLLLTGNAHSSEIVQGLFCNEINQIEFVFSLININFPTRLAVEKVNADKIACVYADKISYVIAQPEAAGQVTVGEHILTIYKARLVGVLVGSNQRAVDPPVKIFFVPFDETFVAEIRI